MMRALALALLLAACAKTQPIYAGSDTLLAGGSAVDPQLPGAGAMIEPPPMSSAGTGSGAGSGTGGRTGAVAGRDAGSSMDADVAPDAASMSEPDAALPDAGAACATGFADCDGDPSNGCEVDIESDMQHCGGCGRVCHADGAGVSAAACVEGRCQLTCQYAPIRGDCDGDPDNGCEVDLWHDANNCSVCGMRCNRCADSICR